jgi:hypothetical protein
VGVEHVATNELCVDQFAGMVGSGLEFRDTLYVNVESDDMAELSEGDSNRQAYISQADYSYFSVV